MLERDERILKHIGLYRVSLRGVIEELFFEGKPCDHVIERLLQENRIHAIKGLPDNLTYYQLTLKELRNRAIPKHRSEPRGERLPEDLAVLWFSCMAERQRTRLERQPLGRVFGRGPGMGMPHCRERVSENHQIIYRIRFAGPDTDNGRLLRGVLSRNRRKFRQPINVACPAPGRWGRPNSRVTSRHFDHGNASRTSRPDCSGLDEAD